MNKATYESEHLIEGAKQKANQILRDATDEAKRVAIETEELKRQTRVFHQRLMSTIEGQLGLINSPEWTELLQPTAVYLQNSDAAFKEVVEKVLDEEVPESNDYASADATRQFSPEEMEDLQRRVAEGNRVLHETQQFDQPLIPNDGEEVVADEPNLNETQTFKLNINE